LAASIEAQSALATNYGRNPCTNLRGAAAATAHAVRRHRHLTDEDPPFSRNELSYDPTTGSPLGRAVEIEIRKKF
jgi:hypothetical protein